MRLVDRLLGLISAPAYALRRSRVGFVRLHTGAVLLCLAGAVHLAYQAWLVGFHWIQVLLILTALLLWAHSQRYLVFRPCPIVFPQAIPDLPPERKLSLRGSGFFAVNDVRRYLVEAPVTFWTTQLADHILAAKVNGFSFLGVGVPRAERGWWYVFIEPRKVIEIVPGKLCFGPRVRPAVRVTYATQKAREVVYLSCDDRSQLAVLRKELQAKMKAAHRRNLPPDTAQTRQ